MEANATGKARRIAVRTAARVRNAPGKINLALHVTGRCADGYHEIDTLVGFADISDRLTFEPAPEGQISLVLEGPFAGELAPAADKGETNLVIKAAELLTQAVKQAGFDVPGAAITLEKHLPVAGGIGGGSADAAATLLALKKMWALPERFPLDAIAVRLGADVAMCLASRPLRATGIGEKLELLANTTPLNAVLVNPGVALSTPQVFAALERRDNPPIGEWPAGNEGNPFEPARLGTLRNDLEEPARALQPIIGDVLDLIAAQQGCLLARMSGSGATCFGLFGSATDAQAAHRHIVDTAPQWWSAPTRIGAGPV